MIQKQSFNVIKGMRQDISPSKANPEYIFDARNIRLTARGNNTLLSISNEQGNKKIEDATVNGKVSGYCVLGEYLIIFTKQENTNYIYRWDGTNLKVLYSGILNFGETIQTLGIYENENIQKVYWIDGVNQPRVINIVKDRLLGADPTYNTTSFDFVPELALEEVVEVYPTLGGNGQFATGTIQYAFTYYNKYGQETNIFYTTDLYYITYSNRGGSPEDNINISFKITINNLDDNFDYVRIYSIHRTSLNATPYVKRVIDLPVQATVYYTDTGNIGEAIDPILLLYVGGEEIFARTLAQKDNTLFLGNIILNRPSIPDSIKQDIYTNTQIQDDLRTITVLGSIGEHYKYGNQLTVENPTTFKSREHYRLGLQFQHKSGKWSEPIFISDYTVESKPYVEYYSSQVEYNLPMLYSTIALPTLSSDFKRVRALVVNPTLQDRKVIMQGMLCPTVYTTNSRASNTPYSQSSWFLRPFHSDKAENNSGAGNGGFIEFQHNSSLFYQDQTSEGKLDVVGNPSNLAGTEIEFSNTANKYKIDQQFLTFHSPDIEFDSSIQNIDQDTFSIRTVGKIEFNTNVGDISIETSSPTIGPRATGFEHSMKYAGSFSDSARGLISGWFYKDWVVDDNEGVFEAYNKQTTELRYFICPWQSSGSLNNDIVRPTNSGARSAVLKRKVISNIKTSFHSVWLEQEQEQDLGTTQIGIFNSNEVSLLRIQGNNYYGNIDTIITPTQEYSKVVRSSSGDVQTIVSLNNWGWNDADLGDNYDNLRKQKYSIRMKYKSSPHAVFKSNHSLTYPIGTFNPFLYMAEIYRKNITNPFGGTDDAALRSNIWIPSGPSVYIEEKNGVRTATVQWLHGDCYYQRYDCLKTYPFTNEDENSIVEIGSFMVETRVNIDGRYDRNRGLTSNLHITPQNFNLLNPVYSQQDNFFNYRVLDKDFYNLNSFPNSITWSKEKTLGEDVDTWTNTPMTNIIDLDGDRGKLTAIKVFNNELYAFQDKGVSNILFNNRVQIPTSDNVPIEISNGYKVQGKRYLSNSIGCQNQQAVISTPNGIYFSDLYNSDLYLLNQQGIQDISTPRGFTNWVKEYHPNRVYFDTNNSDVYFLGDQWIRNNTGTNDKYQNCICFSEKLNEFTSFMDYNDTQAMFNVNDEFYAFGDYNYRAGTTSLYKQFDGDYGNIFGYKFPYSITYIANQNPNNDKIFNNIEFRGDSLQIDSDKLISKQDAITNTITNKCPFDYMEVWNEYQYGIQAFEHILGKPSSLKQKFRIWRANIPRDSSNNRDRIRNPWIYLKLGKAVPNSGVEIDRIQLHDLQVYYYDNSVYGYSNQRQ